MMGLCFLAALYCLVRTHQAANALPWRYRTVALSVAIGMLSKQVIVVAPLVLLIFERTIWRRLGGMFGGVESGCTLAFYLR